MNVALDGEQGKEEEEEEAEEEVAKDGGGKGKGEGKGKGKKSRTRKQENRTANCIHTLREFPPPQSRKLPSDGLKAAITCISSITVSGSYRITQTRHYVTY